MTKADSVLSTPRILTPQFPLPPFRSKPVTIFDIAVHQLQAMLDLHRMRREAEQEIERLLIFLDMTDSYTLSEREPNGDELDASYPNSGAVLLGFHTAHEDSEDDEAAEDDGNAEEHEPSGIADMEGLYEQVGGGDWQGHAYV